MKRVAALLALLACLFVSTDAQEKLPKPAREFRGMWIATVANLDFPSKKGLPAEQQKTELVALLDLAVELKMNAVVFQVRSMGDAVYLSETEPSSPFVTGVTGKALEFDPLKFLIDEAHARGILVHAWFNPYRATHASIKDELPATHVSKRHSDWLRPYSTYNMLDPGLPEVRSYLSDVVSDVVRRYDVDGVHFDDYFYPYLDANQTDFPDSATFDAYKNGGGKLAKADWRRKNVDDLIQLVSAEIKKTKPHVMFGISPFGIWKPDDISIKGTSAYDTLYADSRKWLQEGWVDYMTPQLYWSTTKAGQEFAILLKWWNNENKKKRHLWVGVAPYKVGDEKYPDYSLKEMETQVGMTRTLLNDNAGTIHFRALSLASNKHGLRDHMREKVYRGNSLIPLTPWIKTPAPPAPELNLTKQSNGDILAAWKPGPAGNSFRWILYWNDGQGWKQNILPPQMTQANLPANMSIQKIAVVATDRLGNLSEPTIKEVKK
jgi:uncharacterized lipoprotein YddW (UPF0748 family)